MRLLILFLLPPLHASTIRIESNDMAPAITAGAVLSVDESVPFGAVQVGDLIKFRQGWAIYCHRVVAVRIAQNGERFVVTRGDRLTQTEVVTVAQYRGRVNI
jgi:hypothetical protein